MRRKDNLAAMITLLWNLKNVDGDILGIGLVNYGAADIRRIRGLRSNQIKDALGHKSYNEVIQRDNLALSDGIAV